MCFLDPRCSGTQFENLLGPRGSPMTTGWKEGAGAYSFPLCLSSLILSDPRPRGPSTVAFLHAQPWNGRTSDGAYHSSRPWFQSLSNHIKQSAVLSTSSLGKMLWCWDSWELKADKESWSKHNSTLTLCLCVSCSLVQMTGIKAN